ncbi:hypothetical protein COV19_05130 [Candidatus Woesearchaeota archaeon CG10_big_fil_rev_8_21_14_0_10_44_13]|nr:MAG: hypothetical protein COV19_05130 [Candidatus Woesearchaeota archaeon CG10_big_fil_rev_8_21_14_0_10_44_13]
MEFLLNYGWIILIVLILIAALSYYGVLNPRDIIPETCIFKAGFDCMDHAVNRYDSGTNGVIKLKLMNSLGETVTIAGMNFFSGGISLQCMDPAGTKLTPGKAEEIFFECQGDFPEKEKLKFKVEGKYFTTDPAFTKEIYGELTSKITTIPAPSPSFSVKAIPLRQWGVVNTDITYQVEITNKGNVLDNYNIYKEGDPNPIPVGQVKPGDTVTKTFTQRYSSTGTNLQTKVTVKSFYQDIPEQSVTFLTTITPLPTYDFTIVILQKVKFVPVGGTAEYSVILRSTGSSGKMVLSSTPSQGITLSDNNFYLASGMTKEVKMTVTPTSAVTDITLMGTLETKTNQLTGIKTIIGCEGYTMSDPANYKVDFFNSKINFGGAIATKENSAYPDYVLPAAYKIVLTGSLGADTLTTTDPVNMKFNIVKTGLVNTIEVTPMYNEDYSYGTSYKECTSKKATLSNVNNIDTNGKTILEIWGVWDDDGARTGATVETDSQKVFSGESYLNYPKGPDRALTIAGGAVSLQDMDYFTFAVSGYAPAPNPYGAYFFLFLEGYHYMVGTHPCALPGVWAGWGALGGPLPGANWQIVNVDLDTPRIYPCTTLYARPISTISALTVRVPYYPTNIYLDALYFYKIVK